MTNIEELTVFIVANLSKLDWVDTESGTFTAYLDRLALHYVNGTELLTIDDDLTGKQVVLKLDLKLEEAAKKYDELCREVAADEMLQVLRRELAPSILESAP